MRLRARLFFAARLHCLRSPVQQSREMLGRLLAEELPVEADVVVPFPIPASPRPWDTPPTPGIALPPWLDPQPLRRAHVHRALAGHSRFRRPAETESRARYSRRQIRHSSGRLAGARDDLPEDRPHGPQRWSAGGPPAHLLPAHHFALLLRRRYAHQRELSPPTTTSRSIRRSSIADSVGYLSLASLRKAVDDDQRRSHFCYACYTGDYPTELVNIEELMTSRPNRC